MENQPPMLRLPLPVRGALGLALALVLALFATSTAHAQITLTLTETDDPSVMAYSFSGSGTRLTSNSRNAGIHFNSNISSVDFVDADFGSIDFALTGTISDLTTSTDYAITGLRLTQSTNGDDWSILLTSIAGTTGNSYSVSGSGTFSLGSKSFANFITGTSSSNVGTGSTDFGPATMTVQASAVPEPSTYALALGLAIAGFTAVRRRRHHSI